MKMNTPINTDTMKGGWNQLKGRVKAQWGKLTDDELAQAEGNLDALAGKIQERYGVTREKAREQLDDIKRSLQS